MPALRTLLLLLGALCLPVSASAVTMHDIIELTRAGLPDDILVAVIDADRTIFTLDKDQILELKHAGVSHAVLLKMLRTRREFDMPVTPVTPNTPVVTTSADAPTPGIVVIGVEAKPEPPPLPTQYYYVPYPIWGVRTPRVPHASPQPFMSPEFRGFGRFINDGWVDRR